MKVLARALILTSITLSVAVCARSQSPAPQSKEASGSITGQVTIAGKPAANVPVILMADPMSNPLKRLGVSSTTDSEGHFQLTGVPAGRFYVAARAPAFYSEGERGFADGKIVTLVEGESLDDINISLRRGGVITGRITDALGRPLIRHRVTLYVIDPRGERHLYYSRNQRSQETDDRGVYRIYGLMPGRYNVSAGSPLQERSTPIRTDAASYAQVFYPGTDDETKADVVEITEGGEVTGIDIALGGKQKGYTVTIRAVAADTGKPLAGLQCGYGSIEERGAFLQVRAFGPESNERGECRIDGVLPGKYAAMAASMNDATANYTFDPTPFEVTDADVSNVEVKLRAGASINGTLVFDGLSAPEAAAYFRDISINVTAVGSLNVPRYAKPTINADGSFRISGVQSGKMRLMVNNFPRRNITLLRVEREGVAQGADFDVAAGENISGVRLVVGIGNAIIRGELKAADGALPDGFRPVMSAWLSARRVGDTVSPYPRSVQSDGRGRFIFEGLLPGDYEIIIGNAFVRDESGGATVSFKRAQQTVNVTNERDAQITITLEPLTTRNQ
ncbi:MAG: hypothetical protein ACJ74J_15420 [Blastocatellia bacterium]